MQKKSFSPNEVDLSNLNIICNSQCGLEKDSLICIICRHFSLDPLFCNKCKAVYCRNCLTEYSQKNFNNQRPSCSNKCGSKIFAGPPKLFKDVLNNIKIECVYEGCNKYIEYLDFKTHLEKCKYRKYHCNNNLCKKEGLLNEVEAHSKKCKYREINCKYCKKIIVFNNEENHLKEECPNYFVNCKYCKNNFKGKDYQGHITDDGACLKQIIVSLDNRIKELEKLNSEIMKQVANQQSSIKDYENKLKEKNSKIEELEKSKQILEKKDKDKKDVLSKLKTSLTDAYRIFYKDDDLDDEKPLNINNEIKNRENRIQNIPFENRPNFFQQKDFRRPNTSSNTPKKYDQKKVIKGRNSIYNNSTATKTTSTKRRINCQMNLSLNNSDI